MKKVYLLILLVAFSVSNAMAAIQLMEPVITDNYIEFVFSTCVLLTKRS